jgi:hypothetical protein
MEDIRREEMFEEEMSREEMSGEEMSREEMSGEEMGRVRDGSEKCPTNSALCDSCVDPHRKTVEFHMKNLYECTLFPYLGVQK